MLDFRSACGYYSPRYDEGSRSNAWHRKRCGVSRCT
jgi:hypothetical protein